MKSLALPLDIDGWRNRLVTFGTVLFLGTGLTMGKIALLLLDLQEQSRAPWAGPAVQADASTVSPDPMALNDAAFVPWSSSFPEPAAGPAEEDDGPATPFGDPELIFDPSTLTEGQVLALQQLSARRQQLEEREQLLDMRTEVNARTEARLDQQIDRLSALKAQIETMITSLDEAEEQKLARLVKIYETMKPKAAAEIFNRLDLNVLLYVVERMKEAKSAVVLGKMNPAIAKRVTTELARRQERPDLGGD